MIEIYGQPNCSFCVQAKQLCDNLGVEYVYKTVNVDYTLPQLLEKLPSTHRTYPAIFIDGVFLGGFKALESKLKGN